MTSSVSIFGVMNTRDNAGLTFGPCHTTTYRGSPLRRRHHYPAGQGLTPHRSGPMLVTEAPSRRGPPVSQEDAMAAGLILLVFLALLVAFGWSKLRRRLGMGTTSGRTWLIVMAVFIVGVLALWVCPTQGAGGADPPVSQAGIW